MTQNTTQIKSLLVTSTLEFIDTFATKAIVTVDGVDIEKGIYLTDIEGDTIYKYVRLDEERGLVTRAVLTDARGRELIEKKLNYNKGNKGYVVSFPITQKTLVREVE